MNSEKGYPKPLNGMVRS